MPVGDLIQAVGVAFAAVVALVTAVRQFRADKHHQQLEDWTGRETVIDARINSHLERLDREVSDLLRRNQDLEERVRLLAEQLAEAITYIQTNGLPWPPEGRQLSSNEQEEGRSHE